MSDKKFSDKWKAERDAKRAAKAEKSNKPAPVPGQTIDQALGGSQIRIDLEQFKNRHLFIATPAYGGMVGEAYLKAMVKVGILFKTYGLHFTLATIANESLITRGRNTLVAMFMSDPKFTDMMFIDADIHFDAESIIKMWAKNVDCIVGAYPKKTINWKGIHKAVTESGADENEMIKHQAAYVLNMRPDENGRIPMTNGLIPVYDGGTGFMMFKREVIQRMMDKWPDLHYRNDLNTDKKYDPYMYALFDTIIDPETRRYLSEDYTFCRRFQELGGTIWLDPTINLDHQGAYLFKGNIGNQFTIGTSNKEEKSKEESKEEDNQADAESTKTE